MGRIVASGAACALEGTMSELDTLSAILTEDSVSPEPTDGSPPELVSADAPEVEETLDPEERVAAALREGIEDEDAEVEEDEPPPVVVPDTEALAAEAMQWRAWKAAEDARQAETRIVSDAERRVAAAEAHYTREEARLLEEMEEHALSSPDPDAYKRTHREAIVRSVRAHERAWINGIAQETQATLQAVRDYNAKPQAAAKMAAEKGLPPEAVPRLMVANDIRQMFLIADLLVENRNAYQRTVSSAQQQIAEERAKGVRSDNIHPGSTGRARSPKPVKYVGSGDEGIRELKSLLNA
jgi:hypothetical protein